MKRIAIWLLTAALLMTGCVPALAAAGDRTLVHFGNSDGFSQNYIANVFVTDAGVTAYLNGQQQKLAVYPEGGEPVEYLLESETPSAEQIMSEEGYTSAQTMGWFTWKGELYALQYNQIQQQDNSQKSENRTDPRQKGNNTYAGDGGRNRKKHDRQSDGKVIQKGISHFDMSV